MKTLILAALLVPGIFAPAFAQSRGEFGLGGMIGAPTGVTAKFWTSKTQAVDAALGYNGNLAIHGDYLWHAWDVFPEPKAGKLGGYAGVGLRLRNREDDDLEFGFRGPVGLSYWLARTPTELFVELAPVLKVNANNAIDLDGAVGLRYYFAGRR
ncbi:MAG: hypothetical protein HY925_09680 [Elusimicrobia bacterium]|nr:hypothetical protein [Elusimicrobiota bacterium]